MKHFAIFFFLSLVASILYFGCAEKEVINLQEGATAIRISTEYKQYINPEDLNLRINSVYAFVSEDRKDYAVIIRNAYEFMEEVENHYIVRANDNTAPKYFTVMNPRNSEYVIEIYCITDDSWPDAPPKIIILPN